jgi:hypothetical protein
MQQPIPTPVQQPVPVNPVNTEVYKELQIEIERLRNEVKTLHAKLEESNKAKAEQPRQLKSAPTTTENKPKKIVSPNKTTSSISDTVMIVIFGIVVLAAIITFKKMFSKV